MLFFEWVEQFINLVFLELKLAALEIKRNVNAAKKGAVMIAVGAFLLLLALMTLIGTVVAALSIILPVWLAGLIVTLLLVFFGTAFVFTGRGELKDFSFVPSDTLDHMQVISKKLKKHADQQGR